MKNSLLDKLAITIFIVLALLTVAKIKFQDVPRIKLTVFTHNDMQPLYLSSRVWLAGGNPYDPATLTEEMGKSVPAGLQLLNGHCQDDCQIYYPPTAMPIFAVTSFLSWKAYFVLYLIATAAIYLFCLYTLAQMLESMSLKLIFWGIGLVFSPFHAGIGTCNASVLLIPVILLCAIRYKTVAAAAVIGLVTCIKPPLGVLFVGYYVFSGQTKKALVSIGIIVAIAAISILHLHGIDWLPSYDLALSHFSPTADGPGGVAQHGVANIGFLNMQALFYILIGSAKAAVFLDDLVLFCLYAALIFPLFRRSGKVYAEENHMAIMAALCGLTLFLPSLQYYNGLLLLAPALYSLRLRPDVARIFIGVACATFVLPPRWFTIFDAFKRHVAGGALSAVNAKNLIPKTQLSFGQELAACLPSLLATAISVVLIVVLVRWRASSTSVA